MRSQPEMREAGAAGTFLLTRWCRPSTLSWGNRKTRQARHTGGLWEDFLPPLPPPCGRFPSGAAAEGPGRALSGHLLLQARA